MSEQSAYHVDQNPTIQFPASNGLSPRFNSPSSDLKIQMETAADLMSDELRRLEAIKNKHPEFSSLNKLYSFASHEVRLCLISLGISSDEIEKICKSASQTIKTGSLKDRCLCDSQ